jgi:predicted nuclease of restriction endonuclease-like (RecB) superfamily
MKTLPASYHDTLRTLKDRINNARYQTMQRINSELIKLYWDIGKTLSEKMSNEGWGKSVVELLAVDLQTTFRGVKGFSARNLWYMKQFYDSYSDDEFLQRVVAEIPWGQNIEIFTKLENKDERLFYTQMCIKRAWSRPVLIENIKTDAYTKYQIQQNNFNALIPNERLADIKWDFKDEYDFSFIELQDDIKERELENALVHNITNTLGQFGRDFAFMGHQFRVELSDKEYFIDLLFYHRRLKCLIAIELKTIEFKPEHSQQLNWYLHLLDKTVKYEDDNPSIGILLCKSKDRIIVEYALELATKPIGVATYHYNQLPPTIAEYLPTEQDFQRMLNDTDTKD